MLYEYVGFCMSMFAFVVQHEVAWVVHVCFFVCIALVADVCLCCFGV